MNRRGFLKGILAAGVAPAFIGSSILMPVRKIVAPAAEEFIGFTQSGTGATSMTMQEAMLRGYWVKVTVSAETSSPLWVGIPPDQVYVHPGGSVIVPSSPWKSVPIE